jgi:hypothetical protein
LRKKVEEASEKLTSEPTDEWFSDSHDNPKLETASESTQAVISVALFCIIKEKNKKQTKKKQAKDVKGGLKCDAIDRPSPFRTLACGGFCCRAHGQPGEVQHWAIAVI